MRMTDNEIIKALEELLPYIRLKSKYEIAINNATDLISHQKAEIEKLKSERMYYMDRYHELAMTEECMRKSAIKEFAERLLDVLELCSLLEVMYELGYDLEVNFIPREDKNIKEAANEHKY